MICAVVLAAGSSRRMGVQKLLLPFNGKTLISHILDQLLVSSVDEVHVVVGHEAERVSREISARPVSIVTNINYSSGMLSSVRCGLRNLPKECRAVMVVLGDQPSITSQLVNRMLQTFGANKKRILVPLYEDRRGHPIIFSIIFRDAVLTQYDDVGLRGLLHAHPDDVYELLVSTPSVLSDLDTPEDYRRELRSLKKTDCF